MDKRQAYQEKIQAQMNKWNAKIDELKSEAAEAGAEAKIRILERVDELAEKRDTIGQMTQQLVHSGESAWEDLKNGLDEAYREFEKSLKEAADSTRYNPHGDDDQPRA